MGAFMNFRSKSIKNISNITWHVFKNINRILPQRKPIMPEWAASPIPRSKERKYPELFFPRETNSLCPKCIPEIREKLLSGEITKKELISGHYGEVKSTIIEEDGKIIVRKKCDRHGKFEDVLSIDPEFSKLQEKRFYGADYVPSGDENIHKHGSSNIKYGRGAVLTIDLTNRCNMMCSPCFANANQVGYVYELSFEEIKKILDNSISFKPRRIVQVQFSGGEPTLSPHFLDACRYAKKVGYKGIQAATNGIRFALEPDFAFKSRDAGLDLVYFQLDGITNESNSHRHIKNLFDVKMQAIENLTRADIWVTPVTTIINGINEQQAGPLLQFVIDNCDKMDAMSYQPISFTGRDENISDEERIRKRYTISHLAKELQRWSSGEIDPHRDWFPLGAGGPLSDLADFMSSPFDKFGSLCVACHPDCGSCVYLVANVKTKQWAPLTRFFDLENFINDIMIITDSSRGKKLSIVQLALSLTRNFDQSKAPADFNLRELKHIIEYKFAGTLNDGYRPQLGDWTLLWVGGMWFQDLWTYDFRRTEMCSIPYGTVEGEISFCAYNTGVGWRQIIETNHKNSTTAEWFKSKGRHEIFSGNKNIHVALNYHSINIPETKSGGFSLLYHNNGRNGKEETLNTEKEARFS